MDIAALPAAPLASSALRPTASGADNRGSAPNSDRGRLPAGDRPDVPATRGTPPATRFPAVEGVGPLLPAPSPRADLVEGRSFHTQLASRRYTEVALLNPGFEGELLPRLDVYA